MIGAGSLHDLLWSARNSGGAARARLRLNISAGFPRSISSESCVPVSESLIRESFSQILPKGFSRSGGVDDGIHLLADDVVTGSTRPPKLQTVGPDTARESGAFDSRHGRPPLAADARGGRDWRHYWPGAPALRRSVRPAA
jgi:hypothetical protein